MLINSRGKVKNQFLGNLKLAKMGGLLLLVFFPKDYFQNPSNHYKYCEDIKSHPDGGYKIQNGVNHFPPLPNTAATSPITSSGSPPGSR